MQKPRVLVVEDDPRICSLIEVLLRHRGFDCEIIGDGNLAIQHLRRTPYDALVLDLMLPGVFGFDVLRFLQAERPSMMQRTVVTTAADEDTLRDFDPTGVQAMLQKPFEIHEFVGAVSTCVAMQ
jgi:two-component system, sensor histidine kinase and response regulator